MQPFNIIVPARNEAVALARTAPALCNALTGLSATVIYVLNATTDQSAAIICGVFGSQAQIINLNAPGKISALNAGDAICGAGPRVYLDADVTVSPEIFHSLLHPLADGTADLVAPRLEVDLGQSSALARCVGRVWGDQLMRRRDAFMGCTAFSPIGLQERGPWLNVLADDDWARDRIAPARRKIVETARARIIAPSDLTSWLTVRARWIRGRRQLRSLEDTVARPLRVAPRGTLSELLVYYVVRLAAEPVAVAQALTGITWGRDNSSRKSDTD